MTKKELINEILILDNVGETENVDLSKIKKKELVKLHQSIFSFTNSRQNAWNESFQKNHNKL